MALLMDGMAGIHIGVGFCVARSDRVGNAKASKCGTSDSDRLPRFFVYVLFRLIVIDLGRGLPRIVKTLMVYEDNRGNLVHRTEGQDKLNRRAGKEHPVGRSTGVLQL